MLRCVTKVEMHNELADTPIKTGDDSNPALWIALMERIAAMGAVPAGVFGIRIKKKKEDAE